MVITIILVPLLLLREERAFADEPREELTG